MKTEYLQVDPYRPEPELIQRAARVIRQGGLCAFPTETVYGLGANGLDKTAISGIFKAKGRPADNPLILHVSDTDMAKTLCRQISPQAVILARAFWPGPLTLVVPKTEIVPAEISGGLDTVAIRVPDHPVALSLISASGVPVAAPSANLSGRPSPTSARHVLEDLDGKIDLILDGGPTKVGVESTVVSLVGDSPLLLRPGGITKEQLLVYLPDLELDPGILSAAESDHAATSPGMRYRHYSPKAPLTLVRGETPKILRFLQDRDRGSTVGILCTNEFAPHFSRATVRCFGHRFDPESMAADLFEALRAFDDTKVTQIYAAYPDAEGIGLAVLNRLLRAAAFRVEDV
jgi:L-threonylcarbamoyladenylate synthase